MSPASRIAFHGLVAWLLGVWPVVAVQADDFVFHHENVMGTALELRVRADSADAAARAEGRVLDEIDRLSAIFSGYEPESEFRRWQRTTGTPVVVSPELFEVLQACDHWRDQTGGAFDPRVEALTRLWSACAKQGRTPTEGETATASERMSRPAWRLDLAKRTAEHLSDCPLSLDAISKGAIVGRACHAALDPEHGVRGLVLNVGGDLRACGEINQTIGIADPKHDSESTEPLTRFVVRDRAVATSGSSQRGFRINGQWYSHIFDPRTGRPAGRTASATVIAASSADADALATAFNVLNPVDSLRIAASMPGLECLIVEDDGRIWRSGGFPAPLALADIPKIAPGEMIAWGDENEVRVDLEINRPEGDRGRYRRPYVAVWVEDKDGVPVRNLALWVSLGGPGPSQWLPDLKRWYSSDQLRKRTDKTDMVLTISRPTRPPGKYTVIWNGKDDHDKPLSRGEYTLCIDAAREHGTYQTLRTPLTIADEPFSRDLPGGVEIKAASVTYRRRPAAK